MSVPSSTYPSAQSAIYRRATAALVGSSLSLAVLGCGGSGSSDGGAGSLSARVFWQQPDGSGDAITSGTSPSGGFGPELPAAVRTVRLDFAPSSGAACCVAIDPSGLVVDPDTGRRRVVLTQLPSGPGLLTIAGFPGGSAPAPAGANTTCGLEPADVASPCVASSLDGPSFISAPTDVTVRAGTQVNAGDILVPAVPFIVTTTLQPVPGGSVPAPVQLGATVAISGTTLPIDDIDIATTPGGAAAVTLTACDDATSNPCSPGGALEVRGLRAVGQANVPSGNATVEIVATGDGTPPLSLSYDFTSQGAAPSATPTGAPQATSTSTVPPSTPPPSRTVATPTFTPTQTIRATAVPGSPTATPDFLCGPAPASTCQRPIDGTRSSLVIGIDNNPADDRMVFEWERGNFVDGRDFGDPGLATSYSICIYDGIDGTSTLVRELYIPPGDDWSPTDDGFRYDDPSGRRDGIERIDLVAGQPGRANIFVRGGGVELDPPTLPFEQNPTMIYQVKNDSEGGHCWETVFSRPAERNDAALFRDNGDNAIGN